MSENKKPSIRFKGFTEAWEQRKLGEIADVTKLAGFEFTEHIVYSDEGSIIALRGLNVKNGQLVLDDVKYIDGSNFNKLSRSKLYLNDVLFTYVGTVGELAIIPENERFYLAPNVSRIRFQEEYNASFMVEQMGSKSFFDNMIFPLIATSSQPALSMENIRKFIVSVPKEKSEQEKIGEYFSNLDHLITLHQRKYDKLMNVKKSMLEKMFPRDVKNVPEIRFYGFTEAWEQRKLSEIATMHARIGWQNLRTSEFLDSGNYMLITGTDFEDGGINYDSCHYVERERYDQDKHIQIKNGSILITKDETLGKVAYVQGLSMPATLNAGVFNVEIKDEKIVDNKYLFQYLKAPYLMDYVDKKATGGTIKHLNQNILIDFPIVMPSEQEQKLIGTYFQQLDHLITLHQREVEKLQNIKKSCLEKMFV